MQFICTHHQDVKIACNRTSETSCNRSLFLWITDLRFAHYYLALFKTIFHYYFNIFLGAKLTKALQMFKIHKIYIYIFTHKHQVFHSINFTKFACVRNRLVRLAFPHHTIRQLPYTLKTKTKPQPKPLLTNISMNLITT